MFIVVSGIAPAKGDLVIDERDESVVGDGDAMGVLAQITERMLGTSEGPFGVDVPVVSEQGYLTRRRRLWSEREVSSCRGNPASPAGSCV